jgi:hypothetical protein
MRVGERGSTRGNSNTFGSAGELEGDMTRSAKGVAEVSGRIADELSAKRLLSVRRIGILSVHERNHPLTMPLPTTPLAHILETDSGVDAGYRHISKRVAPGEPLEVPGALLKWYEVHPDDRPVPDEVTQLARRRLATTPLEARGLGFVILHRCGNDFYFLIVNTWRHSNEVWETVLYKNGEAMTDFAPFSRERAHKPTYCVWELVPVWHEQQAWVRFLESSRDETAAQRWLGDRFAGPA